MSESRNIDYRIFRVTSLLLINAMLFHEILARTDASLKTLRQTLSELDPVGDFISQWSHIINDIDFVPIFKVAREILYRFPASGETTSALEILAQVSINISNSRAALRHDLMGRIFHRLLGDAKYYGAFYTKIPASTLLLKLAIEDSDWSIDWSNSEQVSRMKIGDLACGTGTLLKASLISIINMHIEAALVNGVQPEAKVIHKKLVEDGLWGFDVLTSAAHLAATSIALHDPNVIVDRMRIYAMPMGGSQHYLGSIEFATGRRFLAQRTLTGTILGAEDAAGQDSDATSIELPIFDLITMNPPFTRSVYGNLLFGSIDDEERSTLQTRLGRLVRSTGLSANITSGLGAVFVAIADRYLADKGVLALVLPKTVLTGVTWGPTRDLFSKYLIKYVIVSHEPNNWNFSESSDLSEVLLILQKREDSSTYDTKFINLWIQPKTSIEAITLTRMIINCNPANILVESGTCELIPDSKKYGEINAMNLFENDTSWGLPVSFAQTDLLRIAYHLSQGRLYLPTLGFSGSIPVVTISERVNLGPDGRDVYDGFNPSESTSLYEAFWGIDSESVRSINQSCNKYLTPLTSAKSGRPLRDANLLWSRAGSLMLPKELWIPTNRLSAVNLQNKALSNVWWPTKWLGSDVEQCRAMERRLALWLNSSLGLLCMLSERQETRGPWVKFPKGWWESFKILDLSTLDEEQLEMLDTLWERVKDEELLPFPEIRNDTVRMEIDDVFSKILEIPSLDIIRTLLAREPLFSMQIIS